MATDVAPLGLNRKAQAISCSHGSEAIAVGHRMAPAKAGSGAVLDLNLALMDTNSPSRRSDAAEEGAYFNLKGRHGDDAVASIDA